MQTQIAEEVQVTERSLKPFHESIVDALNQAGSHDLDCLMNLITSTKIPKGHDAIIAAWDRRRRQMGLGTDHVVTEILLRQKQDAEKQPEPPLKYREDYGLTS